MCSFDRFNNVVVVWEFLIKFVYDFFDDVRLYFVYSGNGMCDFVDFRVFEFLYEFVVVFFV